MELAGECTQRFLRYSKGKLYTFYFCLGVRCILRVGVVKLAGVISFRPPKNFGLKLVYTVLVIS
jgi:hypothetical protein